ncbi:MAG: hypothetical protein M1537_01790 [Nitrospirae bacterium]|nr:hypothetical protein [Nitrospirota bacterium]MCL5284201.1 hypothetical protein [Nitrospirota bacterium]
MFYLDDYAFISDDRLMALCDSGRKIQIVLRRKLDPLDPTGVGEVLDVLVREGLVQSPVFQAICLGSETSGRWISGNVSVEEFDRILGLGEGTTSEEKSPWRASMTWEDFNREMERRGLRPEEALDLIDRGKERSQ